jgi:hypothetical protein
VRRNCGESLWTLQRNFEFHTRRGIPSVSGRALASQVGQLSIELGIALPPDLGRNASPSVAFSDADSHRLPLNTASYRNATGSILSQEGRYIDLVFRLSVLVSTEICFVSTFK